MTTGALVFGNVWRVELLGGLRLRHGDVTLDHLSTRHALRLFARLALAPRTAWPRDTLAQALWPELCDDDVPSEVARRRLRNTLNALRALLEQAGTGLDAAVDADRDTVRLNAAAFDIDVHRFERHLDRGERERALAEYRGELLPGLRDAFVDAERVRLAQRRAFAEMSQASSDVDDDDDADGASHATRRDPVVPYLTHFFGRAEQIDALCRAVALSRVVTLTGVGGCGKTRLAAEAARELPGFDDIVFVPLAECRLASEIVDKLRATLGVQASGRPPIEQVAVRLAGRRVLLLLDNVEHLVGPDCEAALAQLLGRLPQTQLLVTSRRPLGCADERVVAIDPLPLPPPDADVDDIARNPAVALFADRARAARSDFHVTSLNATAVLAVCELLGGLPLGIELAAAHIRRHTPTAMLIELKASLRGLVQPAQRAARGGRHVSLDAALDWSWRLLDDAARMLLQSLVAFRGGWTLQQACAIAGGAAADAPLRALADSSLVQTAPFDGAVRFQMLHVVREFVEAPPRTDAAAAAAVRARHRDEFVAMAQALDARHAWPATADLANFIQAAASGADDGDTAAAATLMLALGAHWRARSAPDGALAVLRRLAAEAALPAAQHVALRLLLAACALNGADSRTAEVEAAHALEIAGADPQLRASALLAQAAWCWRSACDGARALALLREAQMVAGQDAPPDLHGRWLLLRGAVALEHEENADTAARCFEDAERLFRAAGDVRTSLLALPGRAACLLKTGQFREAVAMAAAGACSAADLGDVATQLQMLNRLLLAHGELGQVESALAASRSTLRLAHQHGSRYYLAFELWNQPALLARLQQWEAAAQLMAYAGAYWQRHMEPLAPRDKAEMEDLRVRVAAAIGSAPCAAAWERGARMTEAEALAHALGQPARRRSGGG